MQDANELRAAKWKRVALAIRNKRKRQATVANCLIDLQSAHVDLLTFQRDEARAECLRLRMHINEYAPGTLPDTTPHRGKHD